MQLSLTQELRQEMRLAQIIEFSNLMAVPDEVLNTLVGAVCFNPGSIEKTLQERKRGNFSPEDSSKKVQSLYASLIPSKGDTGEERRRGLVISPDLRILENCLGQYSATITPDVTYIGRKSEKPELVFSDHLKGSVSLMMLQLDASIYPETARLIAQLKRFDEWKRKTLRDAYVVIGGTQREFFEDFDKTRLHVFKTGDLADKLGFNESTIYRVLSNRWVEARNTEGNQKFLYARDLLITPDELKRYLALPKLNEALTEEFQRGRSYSDREIAEKIQSIATSIATRTVAKYRLNAGIPDTTERNRIYKSGERAEAYQIE